MGVPVVIAENGLGVPVKPVDSGAPSMIVSENGLGVPIVISDDGAPFVVEGWPPIPDPPENTTLPTVTGTAQVGQTLTANAGEWTNEPDSYAYAWLREGVVIIGATGTTYVPVEDDVAFRLSVSVIATNAGGDSSPATSPQTPAVVPAFAPPTNVTPPVITGVAKVGENLSASTGTWAGYPEPTITGQWQRDGVNIPGATGFSYSPVVADAGAVLRVVATGTNSQGNSSANSAGTDPVEEDPPFAAFDVDAGTDINSGDTGYYSTVYGSISAEPLPDYPLLEFATRTSNYTQVAFVGDCVSIVAGWKPVIDGVTLTGVISDWAFDGSNTSATWDSSGDMAQGQIYAITWIKEI